MHRKFIAFVLSAALITTGLTTSPAHAGDDTEKWIAGAAALAIIGIAIADQKNRKKQTYEQYYGTNNGHGHAGNQGHNSWSNGQGHAGNHTVITPKPYHNAHKALPKQCIVKEELHGKKFHGFSRHCLKRNHVNVKAMPRDCAVKIRNPHTGQRKVVFGGRCLKQRGYSIARAY